MFSYTEGMRVDLAAQCFFNGLLKEFTGWTQDAELKQISMALPNSGQILLLSYAHFSVCGPHKFIFPIRYRQLEGRDLQEGELTFQQALKLILDEEAILGSVSASARHLFYERVMQSAANTASAISLRAADLAHLYSGKLNFIEAEQALLAGHNMHPAPKSRSEFSGEDIRYAPESGQSFGLHWFAVHHSAWQGDVYQSDVQETIGAITEDLGLEFDPLPQGFQLLPMHPWQVPVLREREDIAELFAADLIIDLGNRGDVFLNLLQRQWGEPTRVIWISRRPNFQALDEGVFTDQYFTPGYGEVFYGLNEGVKRQEVRHQKLSSDGITKACLNAIYQHLYQERFIKAQGKGAGEQWCLRPHRTLTDVKRTGERFSLILSNGITRQDEHLDVDEMILCTGYESRVPEYLEPIKHLLDIDQDGQFNLNREFSVAWSGPQTNKVYAVNAGIHSHGILEPQLSLAAWRSATIINDVLGRSHFDLSQEESMIDWGQQDPVAQNLSQFTPQKSYNN
ncbi:IucA/IucC family protein [Shewanella sp.]|uniref:IucA/IucC family protein n=1 Tax=Shewanella sp. TaxID=50422 RepID=UPI001ED136AE|nr:IucA/IucC family protein [Shewanella sp.]NRB25251.1 SidA/IucD/PvdA family monooxygenase [Shewanella sp.]